MQRSFDLVVIGAGVTGLLLSAKASQLGLSTALVEAEALVATRASTRNEGWLHHGTYHAVSQTDPAEAIAVARRCIYGHHQLRAFAPEALESPAIRSFALIRTDEYHARALDRWALAGVPHRALEPAALGALEPAVETAGLVAVYEVNDVGLDVRMLYRKLLKQATLSGAELFLEASVLSAPGSTTLDISFGGNRLSVEGTAVVFAVGAGLRSLFLRLYGVQLEQRFWKSHLLVARRFAQHNLFYLEPSEAAAMQHGEVSIIGMNQDATLESEANHSVAPRAAAELLGALRRLTVRDVVPSAVTACLKVDMAPSGASRSVNISWSEQQPGLFWVLPGKMTEAPYVVDELLRLLGARIADPLVASRPCDVSPHGALP